MAKVLRSGLLANMIGWVFIVTGVLGLAWLLNSCSTVNMEPRWDPVERILYFPSEAAVAEACYKVGAKRQAAGCYLPGVDVIYMSDYRIGVPSQPGIKEHELRHRHLKGETWHP